MNMTPYVDEEVKMRKVRYGKGRCSVCGFMITNNALGRAAHMRTCTKEKAYARIRRLDEQARAKLRSPFICR